MTVFAIPFPEIDPVAFSLGPVSVKWYGLSYMAGLLLGWQYARSLLGNHRLWDNNQPPMDVDRADDLLVYLALAIIVGGRLGQVLLYDPAFYFTNPAEIFKIWKGGMSFHGALIATALMLIYFARKFQVSPLSMMDLSAAASPFGLFLGRVANFINSEHWGRPTDAAIGMVFPNGGPLPRHPSQLYEAVLEGLVMFVILRILTHSYGGLKRPGLVAGAWLVWYAIARSICEFFREPEAIHALNLGPFTAGQFYSLPMFLLGVYLIHRARRTTPA